MPATNGKVAGNPTTVIGLYQIKKGKEDQAQDVIGRHWPTLSKHGLVTDAPARVYKGEWGKGHFFMEIATWNGDDALHTAFSIPEISSIWGEVKELTEDRNGRDGVEYPTVTALPAFDEIAVERHDGPTATGVAIHQIRADRLEELKELLPREYQALREQGFIPQHAPQGYIGKDKYGPFSISIVDWYEAGGPQKAFMNPVINEIWRDVQAFTAGRGGRPASEYLWVEQLSYDFAAAKD